MCMLRKRYTHRCYAFKGRSGGLLRPSRLFITRGPTANRVAGDGIAAADEAQPDRDQRPQAAPADADDGLRLRPEPVGGRDQVPDLPDLDLYLRQGRGRQALL